MRKLLRWNDVRSVILLLLSFIVFYCARMCAYWLRFDLDLDVVAQHERVYFVIPNYVVIAKVLFLAMFGQYSGMLRYFSLNEVKRLFYAFGAYTLVTVILLLIPNGWKLVGGDPRSVIVLDCILSFIFWCGVRAGGRIFLEWRMSRKNAQHLTEKNVEDKRVAILGAGEVGTSLLREMELNSVPMEAVAMFDDDETKWHSKIHGVKVLGAPNTLLDKELREKLELDEVIIAMPSATPGRMAELIGILRKTKLPYRVVPSIAQIADGRIDVSKIRNVEVEDLLARDPVELETQKIGEIIRGKVVFVTGAGGSIGSELCRQIVQYEPEKLVLVEQCEVQMFRIEQELKESVKNTTEIIPAIADLVDLARMEVLFEHYKPQIVFHAAAHKHVPLMEMQPSEAVKNNTFATAHLAEMAAKHEVERFVMISTDKAINPTNVMGASKRMAELYVQSLSRHSEKTKFMAVRFGNVLGSSGSVIPTFKKQIEKGGPVTVTHRDIIRYFMTIPEAVGLVLQCATQGEGGDIFVLDMGEPVRIVDLAKNMITLCGFEPDKDIKIEYIGLRPGEKLYEELSYKGENVEETEHKKIMRFVTEPQDTEELKSKFTELSALLHRQDYVAIKRKIKEIVPEYIPHLK